MVIGLLVPVVLLVIAGQGRSKALSLVWLALALVCLVLVFAARSGILASFRATEEAAKRARAD